MQKGLILTVSQVVVIIILLQTAVLINESSERYAVEVKVVEKIRDLETISYNILLDLCLNLKRWVTGEGGSMDMFEVEEKLDSWIESVKEVIGDETNVEITVENLQITRYEGQACDAFQMAFIGRENLTGWYISGVIKVNLEWLFVKSHKEFKINMAA